VWLIGAVVCLLAATAGPMSVSAGMDGRICAAAPLVLANKLPLPRLSKRAVLGLPCKQRYMRTRPLPFTFIILCSLLDDR